MLRRSSLLILFVSLLAPAAARAHDDVATQVEDLTVALSKHPDSARLLLRRADLRRVEGRHSEALADVQAARRTGADPVASFNLQGRIELEQGRASAARATLTRSLRTSESFLGRWYRARAFRALGRTDDALDDYDRAVALGRAADVFLERGRLLESTGAWEQAADNYRTALRRAGESGVVRARLFEAELASGELDAAVAAVSPMIDRMPIRTRWLVMRARAHAAAGDLAAARRDRALALQDANRALEQRRSPLLLVERARVYAASGRDAAARVDVEEALRRAPHYGPAQRLHARLGLRGAP